MIYLESTWTAKPLSELGERVTGVTYKKAQSSEEFIESYIPLLKANNIENNQILFNDFVYVPPKLVKEEKKIQENDILIAASSGSLSVVGKAAQIKTKWDGSFGAFCKVLRPNVEKVDPKYLSYFFYTDYYRSVISHLASGANINNINNSHFDELFVPLPPLKTQKKIAAVLDQADALRQKRRQTIAKLDELTQSVFLDMFGDPVANPNNLTIVSIKELTTKVSSGSTPKGGSDVYQDEGIQFIRSQNVQMNYLDVSDVAHISMEIHDNMKRTKVHNGDVLLNITGASIGRVAVFRGRDNSANVNQHVCILRPITEKILPEYLSLVLSNSSYQKQILGKNAGATRQAFNYTQIKGFDIPLPPLTKQQELVQFLKRYRSAQQNFQSSERQFDHLFNSLLQKAFKGELHFSETEEQLLAAEGKEEYVAK